MGRFGLPEAGKRFYLLIILELKTRRIVRYDLTENPCRVFVKQRIELFSENIPDNKTLIFDNAPQFTSIDYSWYDIKGVNISLAAPKAGRKQVFCSPMHPGMNAYTGRVIGSIRREALDHYLLFSEKQVRKIIKESVNYYNHQGTGRIPEGVVTSTTGIIKTESILAGLHHNYYRSSAGKSKKPYHGLLGTFPTLGRVIGIMLPFLGRPTEY